MGKKVGKGQKHLGNGIGTNGTTGHQGIKLILGRQDPMKGSSDQAFVIFFFFVVGRRRCRKEADTLLLVVVIAIRSITIGCQRGKSILQSRDRPTRHRRKLSVNTAGPSSRGKTLSSTCCCQHSYIMVCYCYIVGL